MKKGGSDFNYVRVYGFPVIWKWNNTRTENKMNKLTLCTFYKWVSWLAGNAFWF